jgi:hypothetical protein
MNWDAGVLTLKELVEQHVQAMVDEMDTFDSRRQLTMGANHEHDRVTISVLRQHIAVLESQQDRFKEILVAVKESLGEIWWTQGCKAKQRIAKVKELVKEIQSP